jgi:phytoene dehydrogenase-like protein
MTVVASRKLDRRGRATGSLRTGKRGKITWQFCPLPYEMMGSPPFRVLGLAERRVLDRIQCEHGMHGGVDNGRLIVTYQDFEEFGIDRHAIKPAISVCVALGFVEVTQKGRSGVGEFRKPNAFRLTYLPVPPMGPTNEWSKIQTIEEAKAIKGKIKRVRVARLKRWSKPRVTFLAYSREDIESSVETHTETRAA